MRKRFVPSYYNRDLHSKLQTLTQGNMSVEDYHKEIEMTMMRANIQEDNEATMARFLRGLNPNLQDALELQHYLDMHDLLELAIKAERGKKLRRGARTFQPSTTTSWKGNQPRRVTHEAGNATTSNYSNRFQGNASTRNAYSTPNKVSDVSRNLRMFSLTRSLMAYHPFGALNTKSTRSWSTVTNKPAYRMGPEETKELQRQVDGLLGKGWVKESLSPCAVPVVLVPKKDGTWRMCTDCRAVMLSLRSEHEHLEHVRLVLEALRQARLYANLKKCTFCTNELVFLGYVVSSQGIKVDKSKIEGHRAMANPYIRS
nr:uncharacterized protein LOC113720153 [Coffea arabica]